MTVGDLIIFSGAHAAQPGLDYTEAWHGLIVDTKLDSGGNLEEIQVLWDHGKVNDYPASWWNKLSYFPFEVVTK
jgi:hypothetical protein